MGKCCSDELLDHCRTFLADDFFRAFIDESRQKILLLLLENGEMSVNAVAERMDITQPNVSRHLDMLKRAGVAVNRRQGREVYYRPHYDNIVHRLQSLGNTIKQCCPPNIKE